MYCQLVAVMTLHINLWVVLTQTLKYIAWMTNDDLYNLPEKNKGETDIPPSACNLDEMLLNDVKAYNGYGWSTYWMKGQFARLYQKELIKFQDKNMNFGPIKARKVR